jgi:kynurenine formamidase
LTFLKENYGMKSYILVGHSAGACLAFQVSQWPECKGIIGVEGIYDLEDLVDEYPQYRDFVEEAFGTDIGGWREASPTTQVAKFAPLIHVPVQLVQSSEDELLSPRQTQRIFTGLQAAGGDIERIMWIKGTHDSSITTTQFFNIVYTFIERLQQV